MARDALTCRTKHGGQGQGEILIHGLMIHSDPNLFCLLAHVRRVVRGTVIRGASQPELRTLRSRYPRSEG